MLGVGWIGFWLAGRGDFFVIAGSLALPAAIITAVLLPGGAGMILAKGAIGIGGMLLCAASHAFALRDSAFASMGFARVSAGAAAVGLFVNVSAFAKQIELPVAIQYVLGVLAFGGLALLGFALAARLPRIRA